MSCRKVLPLLCLITMLSGCSQNPEQEKAPESKAITLAPAHNPAAETQANAAGGLKFAAQPGWISEAPTSSMRQAQYRFPRAEGDAEDAELAVFFFQGGGGSVQANVERWIGQFSKSDGSPAKDIAKTTHRKANGIPLTVVDVTGTYDGGMAMQQEPALKSNYRMLAAVAEASNGPWFFKLTGPAKTILKWQPSFDAFLESIAPGN
jgi:hypothetical protein